MIERDRCLFGVQEDRRDEARGRERLRIAAEAKHAKARMYDVRAERLPSWGLAAAGSHWGRVCTYVLRGSRHWVSL